MAGDRLPVGLGVCVLNPEGDARSVRDLRDPAHRVLAESRNGRNGGGVGIRTQGISTGDD